jgi:hypothetical protein
MPSSVVVPIFYFKLNFKFSLSSSPPHQQQQQQTVTDEIQEPKEWHRNATRW